MRLLRPRRRRSAAASAYRASKPPALGTPWRDAHYAVVDLETTGLDPRRDEIVSFASIPIDGARVIVGGTRTTIVRPASSARRRWACLESNQGPQSYQDCALTD